MKALLFVCVIIGATCALGKQKDPQVESKSISLFSYTVNNNYEAMYKLVLFWYTSSIFWSKVYCFSFFLFKLSLKPIFACVRYQYGSKQKYPAKNHITRLIPLDHLTSRRCDIALTSKIIQHVFNCSDLQPLLLWHSTLQYNVFDMDRYLLELKSSLVLANVYNYVVLVILLSNA